MQRREFDTGHGEGTQAMALHMGTTFRNTIWHLRDKVGCFGQVEIQGSVQIEAEKRFSGGKGSHTNIKHEPLSHSVEIINVITSHFGFQRYFGLAYIISVVKFLQFISILARQ